MIIVSGSLGGRLMGLAVALAGVTITQVGHATTFSHLTQEGFSDSFGNSSVNGSFDMKAQESASEVSWNGGANRDRDASSIVWLHTSAKLFKQSVTPFSATVQAYSSVHRVSGVDTYSKYATGNVFAGNSVIYSDGNTPCGTSVCASYSGPSLSRTFASSGDTFYLGPVPITVSGSLVGSAHAGLSAGSNSNRYLGIAGSIFAGTSAQLDAGAALGVRISASASYLVVGFGFDAYVDLLATDFSPTTSNKFAITDTNPAGKWTNLAQLGASTMNGHLDLWGSVFGIRYTRTITSWSGYSFAKQPFWDDSGTGSF